MTEPACFFPKLDVTDLPADGDVPVYNAAADLWKPTPPSAGSYTAPDSEILLDRTSTQTIDDDTDTRDNHNRVRDSLGTGLTGSAAGAPSVTIAAAGIYFIKASVHWAAAGSTAGKRYINIVAAIAGTDPSNYIEQAYCASWIPGLDSNIIHQADAVFRMAIGDTINAYVYQNSGGTLDITYSFLHVNQLVKL